jgi:hypothetical protein
MITPRKATFGKGEALGSMTTMEFRQGLRETGSLRTSWADAGGPAAGWLEGKAVSKSFSIGEWENFW